MVLDCPCLHLQAAGPPLIAPGTGSRSLACANAALLLQPKLPCATSLTNRSLVPVDVTSLPCMYVFVDIKMDTEHFIASIRCVPAGCCSLQAQDMGLQFSHAQVAWLLLRPWADCPRPWQHSSAGVPLLTTHQAHQACPNAACRHNFPPGTRLVMAGTIQFASCLQARAACGLEGAGSVLAVVGIPQTPVVVLGLCMCAYRWLVI